MNLVDNIHPVFRVYGSIVCLVTQITDVVNAVVAGGVNLNNVKYRTVVNSLANGTFVAGIAIVGMRTVDRLGKYLGAGCFARSP